MWLYDILTDTPDAVNTDVYIFYLLVVAGRAIYPPRICRVSAGSTPMILW
jgi:hypothetical protein